MDVKKHFCMWYDSQQEKAFIMEKPDGTKQCFITMKEGLYYLDTGVTTDQVHTYHQAMLACKLQKMIGYPYKT
jgi:hypothetical protein